jgi:glycosyltransferase involved in cell wall biosynthesis
MMRILFVVQRYGRDVPGGAESLCRDLATRLAARGNDVHVATTCARSYADWADEYEPGLATIDGVAVHRFPVARPRDAAQFGDVSARMTVGAEPVALELQEEWMRLQGPWTPALIEWLDAAGETFDVAVFVTYLYWTTWAGLRCLAGRVPTLLLPTAHDEPTLRLPLFNLLFALPDALAFLIEEEAALVRERFPGAPPGAVLGAGVEFAAGVDRDAAASPAAVRVFRDRYGLADRPYLVVVGRLDPAKGSDELADYFVAYRERNPQRDLALVVVGEPMYELTEHPDVVVTGFVDDATRRAAVAGAAIAVQPSYFESFSLVLAEAWLEAKPALVQRACAVTNGQARRSGAGIPYRGYAEFEAAVDLLLDAPDLGAALGARGRAFVEQRYRWDAVLTAYERVLQALSGGSEGRAHPLRR